MSVRYKKREPSVIRGVCVRCNNYPQTTMGGGKYRPLCSSCHKARHNQRGQSYKLFKKEVCECCGFIPTHACQLDVDHINGDHGNSEEWNLQTLCANCHRLKTHLNGDTKN